MQWAMQRNFLMIFFAKLSEIESEYTEYMGAKTKRAILSEWLAVGSRDVSVSYGAMP